MKGGKRREEEDPWLRLRRNRDQDARQDLKHLWLRWSVENVILRDLELRPTSRSQQQHEDRVIQFHREDKGTIMPVGTLLCCQQ